MVRGGPPASKEMIKATANEDSAFTLNATVRGLAIYLDNFAIKSLAKGDPERRKRFVAAVHEGCDLLFSVANAAELSGPLDGSFDTIKSFLNELGAHWFPVELNTVEVVSREVAGEDSSNACISRQFMKDYFNVLVNRLPKDAIISLSEDFFQLGPVMEWLAPQRDSIRRGSATLDDTLFRKIAKLREKYERDPGSLDSSYPALSPFNALKPATFAYFNLIRTLVFEAKSYKFMKGDGRDFSHAVMASAFASVGTLDKQWKRRIEALPQPNGLARIYYEPELDDMVSDIELHLASHRPKGAASGAS